MKAAVHNRKVRAALALARAAGQAMALLARLHGLPDLPPDASPGETAWWVADYATLENQARFWTDQILASVDELCGEEG